jgi:CelD/BcsL family acetyltransferase involved in cellulose biosynthesis
VSAIVQKEAPQEAELHAVDVGGVDSLFDLETRWDDLVSRCPEPTPFLRARWWRAWWEAFGEGRAHVVTVCDPGARIMGAAVFAERRGRFEGVPVRMLSLASNAHSNRAGILADANAIGPVTDALARWAHENRSWWSVFRMDEVPGDCPASAALLERLAALGHPTGTLAGARPPFLDLSSGLAEFDATLKAKWRSNLRNREKRLAALGKVVHETILEPLPDLDARLAECFALEAKAWKGAAGSAIASSPRTLEFYRRVASEAAEDKTLILHTLRLDNRLAAFQLDFVQGTTEYVLKIGYEPELSAYSPGALLLRRVIDAAAARGAKTVDLLGDDMPWKRDWTSRVRAHEKLFAFGRGPTGRLLHALRFHAVPLARRLSSSRPGEHG